MLHVIVLFVYVSIYRLSTTFHAPLVLTAIYTYATGISRVVPLPVGDIPLDAVLVGASAACAYHHPRLAPWVVAQLACLVAAPLWDVRPYLLPALWCLVYYKRMDKKDLPRMRQGGG